VLSADGYEGNRNLTGTQYLDELASHTARSLLFEEHLFAVESRFSVEYTQIEQRVEERPEVHSGEFRDYSP